VCDNPDRECNISNGRDALLVHVKNLKPDKTDKQLKNAMTRQLGLARKGTIF
jgi:hypothetical protein